MIKKVLYQGSYSHFWLIYILKVSIAPNALEDFLGKSIGDPPSGGKIIPSCFHNISNKLHSDFASFSKKKNQKNCQNEVVFGTAVMEWNKCTCRKVGDLIFELCFYRLFSACHGKTEVIADKNWLSRFGDPLGPHYLKLFRSDLSYRLNKLYPKLHVPRGRPL